MWPESSGHFSADEPVGGHTTTCDDALVPDTDMTSIDDGLAATAEALARNEEADARLLADAVTPVMPDMGPEARHLILDSCRANLRVVAELLKRTPHGPAGATLPPPPPPPVETLRYVDMLVRHSHGIESMLRGYRDYHAALWRCCVRAAFDAVEDPSLLQEVMEKASEITFSYINAALERVREEFSVQREAHLRWPLARKLAAVDSLLHGTAELRVDELSRMLGYDISRRHVGMVLHNESPRRDRPATRSDASELAGRIEQSVPGAGRPLVLSSGNDTAWLWFPVEADLGDTRSQLIKNLVETAGATLGMGEPGNGVDGFCETHHQAREALDIALLVRRPVTRYGEVALVSAVSADHSRAMRMMRYYLGSLRNDTPGAARLRDTLQVLLENNLNQRETARRLGMHAHSISYRLRQIEEILGRPLAGCATEVRAALLVREILGCGTD